ncbi:MAG: glycosyltransferase [Acidimicrobiia bacterium]
MKTPNLSVVVLAWNKLELTRHCVDSIRSGTRDDYELILVDNGSTDGGADFASAAADKAVINAENLGFAAGNNSGLAVAIGTHVAFVNNDTVLPAGWDVSLTGILDAEPHTGMVLPAVTAAGNPVTVRTEPGEIVEVLLPFGEFPSGVVVVMRRSQIEGLGGWNEEYERASGEDLDLAFTVWAHGLDVVVDTRVLVEHASQASMKEVPGLTALYRNNLERFLDRWDTGPDGPMLDTIDRTDYLRNLDRARTAVTWIRRMMAARDEAMALRRAVDEPSTRPWFRSRS